MNFDDSGDFNRRPFGGGRPLTQREIDTTGRRIRNIVGDPARDEFGDNEFAKWSERQVDRTTDIDGNIVNTRIEPFKPEVKRQDLNLDGSVGDKADNFRRDVLGIKKVMSKAGAFDFDPGNEPTTVANDRFKKAIRTFQAGNDLAVDGLIRPGGPTVHALGFKTMGQENGRPSGFDAADFKRIHGKDGNRFLNGKPIFAEVGALDTNTTLPAGGEGNVSFGGPLELHGSKNKGETHGHVPRPAVTHRQAERKSFEKLEGNKQTGGPDVASAETAAERRIVGWIKDIKTEHPSFVRANALVPGGFFSMAAAKDLAKLHQLPKEYRAYIKGSLEAGGTRAGQAVAFLRSLHKVDPDIKKKVSFKTLSHAAGLWASAKRWGFGKEEFERLGAAKVYDLVARFERAHLAKGKDFQKLNQELESNFVKGKDKYWEFRQKIENRIFKRTRNFQLWSDRSFVDRLWRDGTLDERYEGWRQRAIDELARARKDRTFTGGEALGILGLVPVFFPPARIPVAIAKGGAFALGMAEKLAKREFDRRLADSELRFSIHLAMTRRFLAQLKKDRPNLFKASN